MSVTMLRRESRWECPACDLTDVTYDTHPEVGAVAVRMHNCAGMAGLSFPMVAAGTDCKVEARERDDYIGDELVQYDANGRPVMAVVTTRADGSNDATVYAPCARVEVG